ncbi:MAG: 50S ribosomal protein L18Ae [Candidatus Nanohaloarchaea archaeon]
MATYTFSGKIRMGDRWQKFEREIEADSEDYAKEKVLSELGSEHSVPRGNIKLSE